MNSFIKTSGIIAIFAVIAFTAVLFVMSTGNAMAFGGSGDGGCCGGGGGGSDGGYSPSPEPPVVNVPAKCIALTASPNVLPQGGGDVTLTWQTSGAYFVNISGVGNNLDRNGSTVVHVTKTTTFVMTVVPQFHDQNVTCSVKVTVEPPVTTPATCDSFTSNKSTLPYGGGDVTLSWATTNATSVSINNGVGTVSADGSKTVFVPSTRTFTLTAVGTGGNDTCTVTVTVEPPIDDVTPRCDYFNVSDSRVEEGDRVTLSWGTTNADRVTISPNVGDVADDGSTTVTVYDDTTYTLRARNLDNGKEVQCSVTVRVDEEEDEDDDREVPRCDLEVSDTRVSRGEKVTLSWETTNADSVRIRDDRGKTIFDTSDYSSSQRRRYLDGEIDVIVNQTTTFTLTARGDDGSKTCRVTVKTDDIAVYEKRDQGMVIALTQVPYTGFEAGPFLAFVFYAVLTLWALFVAYILVIKKSSILGFSLYKNSGLTETDLENRKKVEALVAKYTGKEWK